VAIIKRLLLVGINEYPGAPLRGCVNDLKQIGTWAVNYRGFDPGNVRMLTDGRAKNIIRIQHYIKWLFADMKRGDVAGIWLSGHGTQIATRDKGELDGLSEVFCLQGFDWDDPNTYISDKWLVFNIGLHLPAGVRLSIGSDSCHSGDLRRSMEGSFAERLAAANQRSPRQIIPPACVQWRNHAARSKGFQARDLRAVSGDGGIDCGFVSGCKSTQTSADALIDGEYHGAMTYCFVKALEATPNAPMREVVARSAAELKENGYDQEPQCEGPQSDLPFLGD